MFAPVMDLRGLLGVGPGEIRAWISVAGAMQRPAKVVEYIPAHHAKCALGFAYWPSQDSH